MIWLSRVNRGSIDASPGNLPRLVTSRSIEKQRSASRIMTKQQVKMTVVERAIDALKYESSDVDEADKANTKSKLSNFLNNL